MTEELGYRRFIRSCPSIIKDSHPKERWSIITTYKTTNPYFISNYGKVAALNENGIFKQQKLTIHDNKQKVYLNILSEKSLIRNERISVAKLVLQHFVGGYRQRRRYIHLDNDIKNCHYSNLRWRNGFIDGIDYLYLKNIDCSQLNQDDAIIVRILLKCDNPKLIELLHSKKGMVTAFSFKNDIKYLKHNGYSDFMMHAYDLIQNGYYKPIEGSIKTPNIFNNYLFTVFKYLAFNTSSKLKNQTRLYHDNIDSNIEFESYTAVEKSKKLTKKEGVFIGYKPTIRRNAGGRPEGITDKLKNTAQKAIEMHKNTPYSIKEIAKKMRYFHRLYV